MLANQTATRIAKSSFAYSNITSKACMDIFSRLFPMRPQPRKSAKIPIWFCGRNFFAPTRSEISAHGPARSHITKFSPIARPHNASGYSSTPSCSTFLADRAAARWDELVARQSHLIDCLSKLSEFKQQVIRLYYRFEMTGKAIAERLGRNVAVVEKTLIRSRLTLRDCIETAMRREERP